MPKLVSIDSPGVQAQIEFLMREFDAVNLWLQENQEECSDDLIARFKKKIKLGVKMAVALGLEDVSQGIRKRVDKNFVREVVDRGITEELAKGLSVGVPKHLFDKLYKSYTSLVTNLGTMDRSAGNYTQSFREHLSRTTIHPDSNQFVSEKACSQDGQPNPWSDDGGTRGLRRAPSEDREASSVLNEDHNEGPFDRCCVCGTLDSEEEPIMTECCSQFVGSLCFEEALQQTGKCCLCHQTQSDSGSPRLPTQSLQDMDYKFHFVESQSQAGISQNDRSATCIADPSETGVASPSRDGSSPLSAPAHSAELMNDTKKWSEWTRPAPEACKPEDKPVKGKGPLSNFSTEPSQKSRGHSAYGKVERLEPVESIPESSDTTYIVRLFDQAVISYLKGLSLDELLLTVEEALGKHYLSTVHETTLFAISLLESGDVQIMSKINQGQVPDMNYGAASSTETFETFMRSRLGAYTVLMHNVDIETMRLSDDFQRMRAIEELVCSNASFIKSLSRPDDVRLIRWTMKGKNLHKAKKGSVTMSLATAAQANEVIARGLMWKGELRYCVKQGPKRKLLQCDGCQDFGHITEDCSSPPRCQGCAGDHQTKACPHSLTDNPKKLKCALCGGRHQAREYSCTVRRGEEERLALENRFYPADAEKGPGASETIGTKSSPPPSENKMTLPMTLPSQSSKNDMYPPVGNDTTVVGQNSPFAAFDTQIIVQQPDGSKYVIPARRIESPIRAPSGSMA